MRNVSKSGIGYYASDILAFRTISSHPPDKSIRNVKLLTSISKLPSPTLTSCYIPSTQYIDDTSSSQNLSSVILLLSEVINIQTTGLEKEAQLQKQILGIVNQLSQNSLQLINAMQEGINSLKIQLTEELQAAQKKAGLFSLFTALIGIVVGLVTMGVGTVGFVVGGILAISSAIKLGESINAMINPQAMLDSPTKQSLMANGIFGLFDLSASLRKDEVGSKLQQAFNLLSFILTFGESAVNLSEGKLAGAAVSTEINQVSKAAQVLTKLLKVIVLVNEGTMLGGMIYSCFKAPDANNEEAGVGGSTALSLGIVVYILYQIFHQTKLDQLLEKKLGEAAGKGCEVGMFSLISMATIILGHGAIAKKSVNHVLITGAEISKLKQAFSRLQQINPALNLSAALNQLELGIKQFFTSEELMDRETYQATVSFMQALYNINNNVIQAEKDFQTDNNKKAEELVQNLAKIIQSSVDNIMQAIIATRFTQLS